MSDSKLNRVGFCSRCGIVREDTPDGTPVSDCICTAAKWHKPGCFYLLSVSSPIAVGSCSAHGLDACEICECDCAEVPA